MDKKDRLAKLQDNTETEYPSVAVFTKIKDYV